MSGSSLDGVDLACCSFSLHQDRWNYRILKAETLPYPASLKESLSGALKWNTARMDQCDRELGDFYGHLIRDFHTRHELRPHLVASHGHTLVHEAEKGITFQAGSGKRIAHICGLPVVNDFRREDVENGGQGAPLVPVGDRLLFGEFDACINLGGFANISYDDHRKQRIAFDTGPANLALNYIANLTGRDFDENGILASAGRPDPELLARLDALEYFHRSPPKSLGREWFHKHYLPLLESYPLSPENLAATVSQQIALSISRAVACSRAKIILVSGGGALNSTLMARIKKSSAAEFHIPEPELIHFKEALVFAFLGLLRYRGEINCLASVTGGRTNLSTGSIYHP